MGWVFNATPRPLYAWERAGTYCIGGWVGPRAVLDGCGKSHLHRYSIPGPSSPLQVAKPTELSRSLEWEVFQTKFIQKIKTNFVLKNLFFLISFLLWDNVQNIWWSRTGRRWQYSTVHACCFLDNYGYRHTLRICSMYCFSTAAWLRERAQILHYTHAAGLVRCLRGCFSSLYALNFWSPNFDKIHLKTDSLRHIKHVAASLRKTSQCTCGWE